jgi:hypothetical protein
MRTLLEKTRLMPEEENNQIINGGEKKCYQETVTDAAK